LKSLKLFKRISQNLFLLALLGTLAAAVTLAPARSMAQTPAASQAPAAPVPAQATQSAAKPPVAQSEEQTEEEVQHNLFRLEGPVVKWTSRTLHIPVETTAILYEVLNFLILALVVGIPLVRWLPKHLHHRREKLAADLESARKMSEDANSRLSAVEAQMAKLGEEIEKFRAEVESEAKQDEAKIKAALAEESTRIVESAEQEIAQAAAQARRGLRNFAADLAIDQAAKQIVLTAETDRALIAEFVGDLSSNGSVRGGKH
jgi:F-type H+-transporting ATPase subunit b